MNAANEDTIRTAAQLVGDCRFERIVVTIEGNVATFDQNGKRWGLYVPDDYRVPFDMVVKMLDKRGV